MDDILVGDNKQIDTHTDKQEKPGAANLKTKLTNFIKSGADKAKNTDHKNAVGTNSAATSKQSGSNERPRFNKNAAQKGPAKVSTEHKEDLQKAGDKPKLQYNRPNNRNNPVKKKSIEEFFKENPPDFSITGGEENTSNSNKTTGQGNALRSSLRDAPRAMQPNAFRNAQREKQATTHQDFSKVAPKVAQPVGANNAPKVAPKATQPVAANNAPKAAPKAAQPVAANNAPKAAPKAAQPVGANNAQKNTPRNSSKTAPKAAPRNSQKEPVKATSENNETTTNKASVESKTPAKKSSNLGVKFNTKSNTRRNTSTKGASLSIIPLGGLGEIGKNMTAIKYGNNIIVVDGGMSFPDDDLLGIDLVIPDYNYLLDNKSLVKGIFVTHGHEDHIGALPYLLRDLNVPVYGGKLTLGLIKGKLKERRMNNVVTKEVQARDVIKVGPFEVEFIRVSHSIPDSFAIAIHTPVGVVLHTGDFKLDMSPVDGQVMDLARLAALGEEGVLLLMADSTNVERPGFTASEKTVGKTLENIFYHAEGRIIVTTFASNVHRIQQAIWAAEKTGRRVAVVGRGMTNVIGIAQELGYLDVKRETFIDIANINSLPDSKAVIITTGSQGETLAGLTRMSQDEHRQVHIRPGDLVVISANAIPGNEKTIAKTMDNLFRHGAEVVHGRDLGIHVSGHASEEDLKLILNLIKPKYFFPVHGEYRMLYSHGKLAEKMGIKPENIFILENGQVLEVNQKTGAITGKVHSGRILIDGLGVGDVGTTVLKDRKQLSNDGIVIINLTIDKKVGRLIGDPYIVSRGFVYEKDNDFIFSEAEQRVLKAVDANMGKDYNLNVIKSNIKNNLAKLFYDRTGRRPIVLPIVMEI